MYTAKQIAEITGISEKKVKLAIVRLSDFIVGTEKDGKMYYASAAIDEIREYYRPANR